MAYKPKNVAKYRDDSSDNPLSSSTGRGGGWLPGATGSDDRESQPKDFIGEGSAHGSGDYSFFGDDGKNDRLNPRTKADFGKASYNYNQPTL